MILAICLKYLEARWYFLFEAFTFGSLVISTTAQIRYASHLQKAASLQDVLVSNHGCDLPLIGTKVLGIKSSMPCRTTSATTAAEAELIKHI